MVAMTNKLTNVQLELLKIFSYDLPESELLDLKELLTTYFKNKVDSDIEKVWNDKGWSSDTIESIANQHTRTPYKR